MRYCDSWLHSQNVPRTANYILCSMCIAKVIYLNWSTITLEENICISFLKIFFLPQWNIDSANLKKKNHGVIILSLLGMSFLNNLALWYLKLFLKIKIQFLFLFCSAVLDACYYNLPSPSPQKVHPDSTYNFVYN